MEKESKGKLEDKVTTVDPLVALVTFSSNVPEALRKQILGPKFGDRKTFAVRTVRQLLYEGFVYRRHTHTQINHVIYHIPTMHDLNALLAAALTLGVV